MGLSPPRRPVRAPSQTSRRIDLIVVRLARECDFRFMIDSLLPPIKSLNSPSAFKFRVARHPLIMSVPALRITPIALLVAAQVFLRGFEIALPAADRRNLAPL